MTPTTYISAHQARNLARLVVGCFAVMLCVVVVGFWTAYGNRKDLVESQRSGCERGKLDRGANAEGWRTAQTARLSSVSERMDISYQAAEALMKEDPRKDDLADLVAARKYDRIATGLEARSKIDCTKAFPDASFIS